MEKIKDQFVTDFIDRPEIFYLQNSDKYSRLDRLHHPIELQDVYFVKMESITFEEEAPRKEALENVLSSMRINYVNFLYLIKGEKNKVSFYYGISKDLVQFCDASEKVNISLLGDEVLKKSLEGNFRGSTLSVVENEEKENILNSLYTSKKTRVLEGVPGLNSDDAEQFQGVDRLIDVMLGSEFMFLITSKYLPHTAIRTIETNVYKFYEKLVPLSKYSHQVTESSGTSISNTETKGTSETKGENCGSSTQKQTSVGQTEGGSDNNKSFSKTNQTSNSTSNSKGTSNSFAQSESVSNANSTNKGKSSATSNEFVDRKVQDWMKYVDEYLLQRIDYGKGNGLFTSAITLFSQDDITMQKLVNTSTALFSGEKGNKVPLSDYDISNNNDRKYLLENLQVPLASFDKELLDNEVYTRTALSQYLSNKKVFIGNWYSVNELGIIAGLPRKEVVGLSLNEEVEFGLNYNSKIDPEFTIPLGCLVQSGKKQEGINVSLDKRELSKHIFVCGVTGSGKTTTCMGIIEKSQYPFLVIEPAKTEYRVMAKKYSDMLVFTLGRDDIAPFRLNPLEFLPTETLSSHVDMVKASIEAAFDMEAAIPQIIESALYECYKKYGWDIVSSKNSRYSNPFADGVLSFPTLADLIQTIEDVVDKQGFDERLKNDYLGSVRARLTGLIVGAKGMMLNTRRSVNFRDLIHKKVVIELENIKSGSEKSLIMGFILSNLCESIKAEYQINRDFKHITLVEEAHRLLSKYMPGDSLNKKNGVETFADMLAEIRKYGECLVIADQIPAKMTPDVLKNTNTKIVHKIFAQDDKDAIGNTISLTNEQKAFLSNLVTGRAVVFSQGWLKSIQVQIQKLLDTTEEFIENDDLRNHSLEFYRKNYKNGVFVELSCLLEKPSIEKVDSIINNLSFFKKLTSTFISVLSNVKKKNQIEMFISLIEESHEFFTLEELATYLNMTSFNEPDEESYQMVYNLLKECSNGFEFTSELIIKYKLIINLKSKKSLL